MKKLLNKPLEALTDAEIEAVLGISKDTRVADVVAEYVRRTAWKKSQNVVVNSSKVIAEVLSPYFFGLEVEKFFAVTLNRANKILNVYDVSTGGVSGTIADPKVIFSKAIRDKASALIVAHNHPSGNLKPSDSDDKLTTKLRNGGALLDISVLDSLIIGKGEAYYSYADEGRM